MVLSWWVGRIGLAVGAALTASGQLRADPVADFYRGRTISLILSTGTGGGYNEYAQSFARYFGDHLPGKPSVVVQHMPGAGGIRATNFLYAVAPKDGATIGLVYGTMTTADVFFEGQAQFDPTKFNWIGNIDGEPGFCSFWHTSNAKTLEDLKAHEVIVGYAGVGGSFDIHPRLLNKIAGTKIKIVSGYKNGNEVNLAMERGEVDGRCGQSLTSIGSTRPEWLSEKKIILLAQFGLRKHPDYPEVPLILDLTSDPDDKAALMLALAERDLSRPILAPPGAPADRVAALRRAFEATMKDPAFRHELEKRKLTFSPKTGAEVEKLVEASHAVSPKVRKRAVELVTATD
jgi:tripartite-type tricarboxylate transporter receptor subunit TctC